MNDLQPKEYEQLSPYGPWPNKFHTTSPPPANKRTANTAIPTRLNRGDATSVVGDRGRRGVPRVVHHRRRGVVRVIGQVVRARVEPAGQVVAVERAIRPRVLAVLDRLVRSAVQTVERLLR